MADNLFEKKIVVIYHAECPDGFGSAYVLWKKFGDTAEYLPSLYKTTPPDILGKDVYIMDYSYSKEILEDIKNKAHKLIMIDHHVTNQENIKIATDYLFDNNHSAAVLTWKYFYPKEPLPKMFEYIEDTDLWKFKLPQSKELGNFINIQKHDFILWNELVLGFENKNKFDNYLKEGEILVAEMKKVVEDIVSKAKTVFFEGHQTLIVNSDEYTSEIGNTLCRKLPPIGIIWSQRKGRISVSLRGDGSVDVSKLAQRYGGGGHKSAAGFVVDNLNDLEKIFDVKLTDK